MTEATNDKVEVKVLEEMINSQDGLEDNFKKIIDIWFELHGVVITYLSKENAKTDLLKMLMMAVKQK